MITAPQAEQDIPAAPIAPTRMRTQIEAPNQASWDQIMTSIDADTQLMAELTDRIQKENESLPNRETHVPRTSHNFIKHGT